MNEQPPPSDAGSAADVIRAEIREQGSIPFARFMELALYHPVHGYYERRRAATGRRGDYYTSVCVGSVFGELLAARFSEWLTGLGEARGSIVEAGAHDGRLAADILGFLARWRPEVWARTDYWILEPSPRRRRWQQETLAGYGGRVRWVDGVERLGPQAVTGVIFANELLDAFPVHRLGWDAARRAWFEWHVGWTGERFGWEPGAETGARVEATGPVRAGPPSGAQLVERLTADCASLTEMAGALPDGFTIEVAPQAADWWRAAARALRTGHLLTFDYGFTHADRFEAARPAGTLRAYHEHRLVEDVLDRPGEQDLTAHVDFSALEAAGQAEGLQTERLTSQERFLMDALARLAQSGGSFPPWTPARQRQFQSLVHPDLMGRVFRVLVQRR